MATLVPRKRHPALEVDEPERVDYLSVVASMAYADQHADESELRRVDELCKHLELSDSGSQRVMNAARHPDHVAINEILERLSTSALRFALIVDAVDVAYADDRIDPAETREIESIAERLDISQAQVAMIHRYVADRRSPGASSTETSRDLAAGLAAAGIPLAALALATLAGAQMMAGVGLAAALGVGSYVSVRWLSRRTEGATNADGENGD